jgi:hypothetical protein
MTPWLNEEVCLKGLAVQLGTSDRNLEMAMSLNHHCPAETNDDRAVR